MALVLRVLVVTAALVFVGQTAACQKSEGEATAMGTPAEAKAGDADAPPAVPAVTDAATTLLFSYVDQTGRLKTTAAIGEVPDDVKDRVLVVDLAKSPEERQAHRYAFFADLSQKDKAGRYPVTVVSRYNAAKGESLKVHLPPAPEGSVVVYSAVWCGFCKKAKRWLTENGVDYIERDVEKTPGAQKELSEKLQAAGLAGGGVPVIDWAGTLIMGFDRARLQAQLEASKNP